VVVGSLSLDLLLGDVHSLKDKRSQVRPLVAQLRRDHPVSVAEVGYHDLHRRTLVGVAVVGATAALVGRVLDEVETAVSDQPHLVLLAARRRVVFEEDE